ncbi:MAG: hypothetical protein M1476_06710 [Candidatus Thermoplasmatota archaeon]|nr:hypothetical protein [Candidatus Thermoplasmatota archaeon]
MTSKQLLIEDFSDIHTQEKCKKSVIRFDKLVKAYEMNTGKKFQDLDELNAWACEIQGMPGYRHLRAAGWNMGNLVNAYRRWIYEKGNIPGR